MIEKYCSNDSKMQKLVKEELKTCQITDNCKDDDEKMEALLEEVSNGIKSTSATSSSSSSPSSSSCNNSKFSFGMKTNENENKLRFSTTVSTYSESVEIKVKHSNDEKVFSANEVDNNKVSTRMLKPPQASALKIDKPNQVQRSSRAVSFGTTVTTSSFNSEKSVLECTSYEELVNNASKRIKPKRRSQIFSLIEKLEWDKVKEFAESNPEELKKIKEIIIRSGNTKLKVKRYPLHHACLKLKHVTTQNNINYHNETDASNTSTNLNKAASAICMMIKKYPKAASLRESRHGCYPIHLLAFHSSICIPTHTHINEGCDISKSAANQISEDVLPLNSNQSDNQRKEKNSTALLSPIKRFFAFPSSPSKLRRKAITTQVVANQNQAEPLLKILDTLVEAYREGPSADSETGRLPLHMACTGRAALPIFERILDLYPAAARIRENATGSLPLHLIAESGVSDPDVVNKLLICYPEAINGKNNSGRTPYDQALFIAGENGRLYQPEILRSLRDGARLAASPQLLPTLSSEGGDVNFGHDENNLQSKAELDFVIDGKVENDEGDGLGSIYSYAKNFKQPHMERNINQPSIRSLDLNSIIQTPNQAKELAYKTELTDLINYEQWSSVSLRIEMYPYEASEWINVTSRSGRLARLLPLHYACERTPPIEAIKALVKASPQSIMTPSTPALQLPLHLACTWHAPTDVICFLISANNESAVLRDEYGNLPIHSACYSGTSLDVISKLMEANPKGALTKNDLDRNCLDITRSIKHDNWKETEKLIMEDLQKISETDLCFI